MSLLFYIAAAVAVLATLMVVARHDLVHALLYLVVSESTKRAFFRFLRL